MRLFFYFAALTNRQACPGGFSFGHFINRFGEIVVPDAEICYSFSDFAHILASGQSASLKERCTSLFDWRRFWNEKVDNGHRDRDDVGHSAHRMFFQRGQRKRKGSFGSGEKSGRFGRCGG
jgi:hypothetical protein